MNNSTNFSELFVNYDNLKTSVLLKIISYFCLLIILIALIFNSLTFVIIISNKYLRNITSMIYLLYISIFYTLSLLEWNLNNFLSPNFGIYLEDLSMFTCKLIIFMQFLSLQSSGFLLTILCIDRYFTIISTPGSFISRLPFRTVKSAHIWSWILIGLVFVLNSHILILNGTYEENKTNSNLTTLIFKCKYSNGFKLFPIWEYVHLILYSLIPFIIMMIFNILLIRKIIFNSKDKKLKSNSKKENIKRNVISILVITFLFLIMTTPVSVAYGFFYEQLSKIVLSILDELSFLNNSTLFFTCFFTNSKFRKVVFDLFKKSDSKYRKSTTTKTRT